MDRLVKIVLLFALASAADAASFDCGKASTDVEKMVCANNMTSQFDEEMSALYKQAKQVYPEVVASQKAWIAQRNECDDENCLVSSYMQRNRDLQEIIYEHEAQANNAAAVEAEQPQDAASPPPGNNVPTPQAEEAAGVVSSNTQGSEVSLSSSEGRQIPSNEVGVISDEARKEDNNDFFRALVFVLLIIIAGISFSLYLHAKGHITIFENFTDLVFVAAFPFALGFFAWLLYFLFEEPVLVKVVLAIGAIFYVGWNIYTAFRSNTTSLRAIGAILAKSFLAGLAVCGYLFSKERYTEGDRNKDESREAYELRLQREERTTKEQQAFWVAAVALLGIYSCRERRFVPLDEYFSTKRKISTQEQPE